MRQSSFPTPQDAENAFYDALERADLEAMMAVWAEDEEIVCVHPGGPRLAGHRAVRESWRGIFAGGGGMQVHVTQLVATEAVMLAVHSVQENFAVSGEKRRIAPAVATNVYIKTAAGWRMVVHHASPAPGQADARPEAPKTLH
ncbi:MAG: nuclear transport factor 2 family protein [Betaproteobacteria bacterium]|nr:nuclear transport factor 2 family protein [Betaproteobacteria bacterium]